MSTTRSALNNFNRNGNIINLNYNNNLIEKSNKFDKFMNFLKFNQKSKYYTMNFKRKKDMQF